MPRRQPQTSCDRRQEVVRPWRSTSPAAVCGSARGAGGASSGEPARPGRRSAAAAGGSSADDPSGAAPGGSTRIPEAPRGARPGTSAGSPDCPLGLRLTDRNTGQFLTVGPPGQTFTVQHDLMVQSSGVVTSGLFPSYKYSLCFG